MTPDEKLASLAAQLNAAEMGMSTKITCPYCDTVTDFARQPMDFELEEAPPLCCDKFADAMAAILMRKQQGEAVDLANRVLDKSNGIAVFN